MTMEQWSASNLAYLAITTWVTFVIALLYSLLGAFNMIALLIRWHNDKCAQNISATKVIYAVVTYWSIFAILNYFLNTLTY